MRLAALAFGVLGGLVASLILGLNGLDASALVGIDLRQISLLRFGLFVIANLGVLGAGVVLAAPLAGAILMILGALAWVAASLVLRQSLDFVVIIPPLLLLVGFGLALFAHFRAPLRRRAEDRYDDYADQPQELPPLDLEPAAPEDEGEYDEPPATQVRAGFFGVGGTAMPARVEAGRPAQPSLRPFEEPEPAGEDNWRPGSRRPPPRQKPMFRQAEDDYDDEEESGWSVVFRRTSGFLSFGLYAALAGAAVLIFLNLRGLDLPLPAAAKIDASPSVADGAPLLSAAPSSEPAPATVAPKPPLAAATAGAVSTGLATASALAATAEPSSAPEPNLITADQSLNDAALVAPSPASDAGEAGRLAPQGQLDISSATSPELDPTLGFPGTVVAPDALAAPAEAEPAAETAPAPDAAAQPMPFPLPAELAAERAGGSPPPRRPAAPAAPAARADTGL